MRIQQDRRDARGRETRRVSLVTGGVNLLLSIAQIVIGVIANSAALIADGIHSASDLVSDVMVWFAALHAARDAGTGVYVTVFCDGADKYLSDEFWTD